MKILVCSDTHGYPDRLADAIRKERPDLIFFLGDGERDLPKLKEAAPQAEILAVRGNCDPGSRLPSSLSSEVRGIRFFACHGHLQDVKYQEDLGTLLGEAAAEGADAVLFGHTHTALCERRCGVLVMNPGSAGLGCPASYGLLTVEGGKVSGEIRTLPKGTESRWRRLFSGKGN